MSDTDQSKSAPLTLVPPAQGTPDFRPLAVTSPARRGIDWWALARLGVGLAWEAEALRKRRLAEEEAEESARWQRIAGESDRPFSAVARDLAQANARRRVAREFACDEKRVDVLHVAVLSGPRFGFDIGCVALIGQDAAFVTAQCDPYGVVVAVDRAGTLTGYGNAPLR